MKTSATHMKIAVGVLQNQRERVLAEVRLARLADGARRRIGPERLVVGAAVVITGEAEQAGKRQDEERRRERQRVPATSPASVRTRRARGGGSPANEELRRVERRQVRAERVVRVLERRPRRVHDEGESPTKTAGGVAHQASRRMVWPNPRRTTATGATCIRASRENSKNALTISQVARFGRRVTCPIRHQGGPTRAPGELPRETARFVRSDCARARGREWPTSDRPTWSGPMCASVKSNCSAGAFRARCEGASKSTRVSLT